MFAFNKLSRGHEKKQKAVSIHIFNGKKLGCLVAAVFSFIALSIGAICSASTGEMKLTKDVGEEVEKCLSPKEAELVKRINEYRETNGLPPITISKSLTKVARFHAIDLHENKPAEGQDSRGENCSLHSWSDRGFWTPVCYTSDHLYAERMWDKPREITNYAYTGDGYENAYWTSENEVTVTRVLDGWKRSPTHNALILETGIWQRSNWLAFGIGIYKNVAVIWFGNMTDPVGSQAACEAVN